MMETCHGCGFGWSVDFQKQYPDVVEQMHLKSHPPELDALRLRAHVEETMDRLLGED